MTHEEKINYLKISAGICNFGFTPLQLDLLVSLFELIKEKEGETDVKSICKIQAEVEERHKLQQDGQNNH